MRRHISIIAVVCVLATLAGCTSKPANSIVEDAVRSEISEKVPERWVKAMLPGRNAEIALIEIQGWGEFNTDQNYWPVKVRVAGQATVIPPFGNSFTREFDEIGEFRFTQDDYGDWKCRFMAPALFGN